MDLQNCRISAINADLTRLATGRRPLRRPQARVPRVTAASSPAEAASAPPTFDLACPICQTTRFSLRQSAGRPAGDCTCRRCGRAFPLTDTYADLTLASGTAAPAAGSPGSGAAGTFSSPAKQAYQQKSWSGQEIFRSPLVALAYERGWRQGFAWAGFPGADKEFSMASDRLRPAEGGTLMDISCGSGLFTRRFLASGRFSKVIAADFSESMLRQARAYLDQEGAALPRERCLLVRADVGRLPMEAASLDAVHAGAAIHCWPDPQAAMAEISRVLKPGGVLVASTFLSAAAPLGELLGDDLVRPLGQLLEPPAGRAYRWWEEAELRDLCDRVGLVNFERARSNRFILFSATKPGP